MPLNSFQMPAWFDLLGLMGWPLALCALTVLTIMLERLVFYIRLSLKGPSYTASLVKHVEDLKNVPKTLRDEVASQVIQDVQKSFLNGVSLLRTISVLSPLLGLLGTILGIISAFKVIAVQNGPVSPNMIADGLWEAMMTTAVGLLIALPAIVMAFLLKSLAERKLSKICRHLNHLSRSYELAKYEETL